MEDGRSYVCQDSVLHLHSLVLCHVDERNRVDRVCRVRSAVCIEGMVCVAVISDDDSFITHLLRRFHHLIHALVNHLHGRFDGRIDTRMTHHVAVSEIRHNPVVPVSFERLDQFILHFEGRHLGLHVVGRHLWRVHQDAVFTFERLFTPPVDEEGHVCIFLSLSDVQLLQAPAGDVFAEGVLHVLLREEDV